MSNSETKEKGKKRVKCLKGILIGVEVLVAVIVLTGALIYFVPSVRSGAIRFLTGTSFGRSILSCFGKDDFEKNVQDNEFKKEEIVTNQIEKLSFSGTKQILVVGIDSRNQDVDESGVNSDTMIVLNINSDTGDVKMLSVYRDTYLKIIGKDGTPTGNYSKVNSAYAVGGIQGCMNTLNANLDLNLSDYVVLNFSGVSKIIDALGGIDVDLTQDEVYQLNFHLADTKNSTGQYAPNVKKAGKNHLVGLQATTYMRIRKAAFKDPDTGEIIDYDFGRTARQRYVISQIVSKAKQAGVGQLLDIAQLILKNNGKEAKLLRTSMSYDDIIKLIPTMLDFNLTGGEGFPQDNQASINPLACGDAIVPKGLSHNLKMVHEFLGDISNYKPSDEVKEINNQIIADTGVQEAIDDQKDAESGNMTE